MKITIETIPFTEMRYPSAGDWYYEPNGDLTIKVAELGDRRYNALVGLHELVEVLLCEQRGITAEVVDAFDTDFEKNRPNENEEEAGDQADAPYRKEHLFATGVEKLMASEMNVDWKTYDRKILDL